VSFRRLSSLRCHLGRIAAACLLGLLALPFGSACSEQVATEADPEMARVAFLLQYISIDYGAAVQDGAVANPFEYQEMRKFSETLVDRSEALRESGASESVVTGIRQLREMIADTRPWSEVRELASTLADELVTQLDLVVLPPETPDIERGQRLYQQMCAGCHGATGGGDGPSASGLDPPPTAFDASRMKLISPYHLFGATQLGIEGTAMPAFGSALDPRAIWEISFFLMTLRSDLDPLRPESSLPITFADLARYSDRDLLARVRDAGVEVDSRHIDYYRRFPESLNQPAGLPEERAEVDPPSGDGESAPARGPDLQVARSLQNAFAAVAEQASPSVVGVTGLIRDANGAASASESDGSWQGGSEERLYPGFRPGRSGSGFLVSEEGYILTAHQLLGDDAGGLVDVVDIELHDGSRQIARIVGTEPTINLGVLRLEQLPGARTPELRPARIGERGEIRVGHWTIALGNPAGPGASFAIGTLSSGPERQCYQEDLTATLMQMSLGVPAGGYGGPVVNIEGEVVGMMVPGPGAELPARAVSTRSLEFALPIDLAMAIYEPLKRRESRKSPWLGFSVLELGDPRSRLSLAQAGDVPPETGVVTRHRSRLRRASRYPRLGVYIDDVFDPSPAVAAGVRIGDILVSIDGHALVSVGEFQRWLYLSGIGRTIELEIFRDGESLEKRVTVAERPEAVRPR
jgi:S1-C subfamily serine protease/mono/diheme cytochrome c family protein